MKKLNKKSKYNLSDEEEEDDFEISGLGPFYERDDFEDGLLSDDDRDNAEPAETRSMYGLFIVYKFGFCFI